MTWIKFGVLVEDESLVDMLCDKLIAADILEFEVVGVDFEMPLLEGELPPDEGFELNGSKPGVRVYVTQNEVGEEKIARIRGIEFGFDVEFSLETMNEEDWAESWKQYFKPIFVGEKIIICPEWEQAPENTDRIVFRINPGMSFGTGSHETTRLCISQLERFVTPDTTVLDLGCGSGILSVIACLLGANSALGVDIDPNSAKIAKENAAMNAVPNERYNAVAGNVLDEDFAAGLPQGLPKNAGFSRNFLGKRRNNEACELFGPNLSENEQSGVCFDVVVANIISDIIIKIAAPTRDLVAENGVFIVSGIILERLDEVKAALEAAGFEVKNVQTEKDWVVLVCEVKNA